MTGCSPAVSDATRELARASHDFARWPVMALLQALSRARHQMPPSARRLVRRTVDPVLAPVGSVAGSQPKLSPSTVGLTFDDGPDPRTTPLVLAALERAQVSATFFLLTERAVGQRRLVTDMVAAGHEIGLHGPDHRRLTSLTARSVYQQLCFAKGVLEDMAGVPIRWFRPPFGSQSLGTYAAIRCAGLDPVVWTTEGEDWIAQEPSQIAARVMDSLRPGGIILLHDALAGDPREAAQPDPLCEVRGEVAAATLAALAARGLHAATVGDLLAKGGIHRTAWFRP